jgi:hypothetical protein
VKSACIHFQPATSFAIYHNTTNRPSYVVKGAEDNEHSTTAEQAQQTIKAYYKEAEHNYKTRTRQKLQAKNYLAEAIVLVEERHRIEDLKGLADQVKALTGFECVAISIHKDEGKDKDNLNLHAHLVFFTLDRQTGKSLQRQLFNKKEVMRQLQTITANVLDMKRGINKQESKAEHLSHKQYKASIALADKHKEQEIHKWHNRLKEKVVEMLESTTTAIKRFFMSNEFEKVEQENNHLKQTITQSRETITQEQHRNELLTSEANRYKEELITEKARHITAGQTTQIERPSQQSQTRKRPSQQSQTRSRTR